VNGEQSFEMESKMEIDSKRQMSGVPVWKALMTMPDAWTHCQPEICCRILNTVLTC